MFVGLVLVIGVSCLAGIAGYGTHAMNIVIRFVKGYPGVFEAFCDK